MLVFRTGPLSQRSSQNARRLNRVSGNVELSFEFQFPNEVKMAPGDMYRPRPMFEDQEGHSLPTSMAYGDNKVEYFFKSSYTKRWSGVPTRHYIDTAFPPDSCCNYVRRPCRKSKTTRLLYRGSLFEPQEQAKSECSDEIEVVYAIEVPACST